MDDTYGVPLDPHCDAIQIRALATWYEPDHELFHNFLPGTLGLVGEAGEFADLIKKRGFKPRAVVSKEQLADELGDVLFYVAVLGLQLGYTLDQLSEMNYEKLMSREREGKGYNRGRE